MKVKELEDENETYDESKRYIRSLLKNLVELERFREKISDINQKIAENIKDTFQEYMKTQLRLFRFLQIVFTVIFSIVFNIEIFDIFQFSIFFICVIISLVFTELLFLAAALRMFYLAGVVQFLCVWGFANKREPPFV